MSLEIRFTWVSIATVILTICSIIVLFVRRYSVAVHRYNRLFLNLVGLGLKENQWSYWIASWILGTGIATLFLTLLVNFVDTILFLIGLSGISFDPIIVPILILIIITSLILLIANIIPILASPPSSPTALFIFGVLHLLGFHGPLVLLNASMAFYFIAIVIGVLGSLLSIYVLTVTIIRRLRGSEASRNETENAAIGVSMET